MALKKELRRERIKRSIRARLVGTAERPRLSVFRSNRGIYAQLINDQAGTTIASYSSMQLNKQNATIEVAAEVGKKIGQLAQEKGINQAVFDRSGYLYHGRVKALADGAREVGLNF